MGATFSFSCFLFLFFFSIPDTLAQKMSPRIGQKDLAIKCSFCRIKQAIWRVFRARHKDSIAAPYFHVIKIQKFSLWRHRQVVPAIMANFTGNCLKKIIETTILQRKNLRY